MNFWVVCFLVFLSCSAATPDHFLKTGKQKNKNQSGQSGQKQWNQVLSQAYQEIIKNGQYDAITVYSGGLGGGIVVDTVKNGCNRPSWQPEQNIPTGRLAAIISRGSIRWCTHESDYGSRDLGLIHPAPADDFLQNIKAGELRGSQIDLFNALTIQASLILRVPLKSVLANVTSTGAGLFADFVAAMDSSICDGTADQFFRHPWREALADYTCPTQVADFSQFGLSTLNPTLDLGAVFAARGQGYKVCVAAGSTQFHTAQRDVNLAEFVISASTSNMMPSLCASDCDFVVDSTLQAESQFTIQKTLATSPCFGSAAALRTYVVPRISSGSDVGALTGKLD